jgi:flagellar basal-body rod protein FlgB
VLFKAHCRHLDAGFSTPVVQMCKNSFVFYAELWSGSCIGLRRMVDSVSQSLEKYMDVLAARQRLVSSNIANVDTPGYRTKDLDFQTEFNDLLNGTSKAPSSQEVTGLRIKNDGNNVNLDREARLLAENSIRFTAASNLMKGQIRMIKSAIHEGQGA